MAQTVVTANIAEGDSDSSFSHTATGNARRMVVLAAGIEDDVVISDLNYGSNSLGSGIETVATVIAAFGAGNTQGLYCVLDADIGAAGSKTVSSSDGGYAITVVELYDTAQVVPSGVNIDSNGDGPSVSSISSTATAQANSVAVTTTGHGLSSTPMTPSGTGTWSTLSERQGGGARFANRYQQFTAGAGSKTITETWSGSTRTAQVIASFEEDTGSGPVPPDPLKSLFVAHNFAAVLAALRQAEVL